MYSIGDYIDHDGLSPKYQSFMNKFSIKTEPSNYVEAAVDKRWMTTMKDEI